MGQKVHPIAFRLGLNQRHQSEWFQSSKKYPEIIFEDQKIRDMLIQTYKNAGISKIRITRDYQKNLNITIYALVHKTFFDSESKTQQFDKIKTQIQQLTKYKVLKLSLEIAEKTDAKLVAMVIAQDIEKRKPFRRAMKNALANLAYKKVEGARIQISGRLNGAEMARTEGVRIGRVPLHTLRAKIDYCTYEAHTIYGTLGIKVWVFKKN
jgi:small subunit ribosomal protein S3